MLKKLVISLLFSISVLAFAQTGFAATSNGLSLRVEQPKSPTNTGNFKITYVALDQNDGTITAKCFKKSPSDAGFSQFGPDVNLGSGNTSSCDVTSSMVNGDGVWTFKVEASTPDAGTVSEEVSVTVNTSAPGTPTYIGKDKTSACTYRIKFKTADDAGKTVKVEIYRADTTSFNVDGGSLRGTVTIGSNTEGHYDDTLVNCDTVFYYAIRAFDSIGNGSGVVGDSEITINNIENPLTVTGNQTGAIALGSGGQVLGAQDGDTNGDGVVDSKDKSQTPSGGEKDVLGDDDGTLTSPKNLVLGLGLLVLVGIIGYILYQRSKKS